MKHSNTAGALMPLPSQGERLVPSIGQGAGRIGVVRVDLTNARTLEEFIMTGNFVWAIRASAQNAAMDVRFNSQRDPDIPFAAGLSIAGLPFDRLYISNAAQAGQSIDLLYAVERAGGFNITNRSTTIQSVALTKPTTFVGRQFFTVGVTAVQVAIVRATRSESIINSIAANNGNIYIGDTDAVTVSNGLEILPGGTHIITGTAPIWGISNVAGQSVRTAEILD